MRFGKILMIITFCGAIGISALVSVLKPETEFSEKENRYLETMPELDVSDILAGDFQKDYEAYINDQFFLRDTLVDFSVGIQRGLGRRDVNGVYIGKDDYLLERYTDEDFKQELMEDNSYFLSVFLNRMIENYGSGHVVCMMVPGKANVLTEKLPSLAEGYHEDTVVSALRDLLSAPEILLDVTEQLKSHQEEYIYYRTDHHWTGLGAYYGYRAWAEHTGRTARDMEYYQQETVSEDFYGTTYNKVHLDVLPDSVTIYHPSEALDISVNKNDGETISDSLYFPEEIKEESDKYRIFLGGNTAKIDIKTGAGTGRTLLLFKDSFANSFVPFLAADYDRIIMVDLRYYSDSLSGLFLQYPDITDVMVLYNVEKFIEDDAVASVLDAWLEEE
ncbi:MAG: hypothetical protein K2G89_01960 [Lachnospiraceae bacterium]|nr:hypothetical protein [Lachnospiraceae bacterium]